MRAVITAALLCVATAAHSIYDVSLTQPYQWPVVRIIDGDTIVVEAKWLPVELGQTISVRLDGVDTPERGWRARCDKERELAEDATSFVEAQLRSAQHEIIVTGWDKFGGRILGDFVINGKQLTELLLNQGLAKPYTGSGTKPTWC